MSDVGRYRKVYPRIWRHPGFKALRQSARELVLYLLSGPQTNRVGLFHLSVAVAAEDMNVSTETVRKGLTDVAMAFGWHFDADARVLYIPSWWRWNKPENENVLKGNLKDLSEIPPCGLVDAFARNLETLPETLHSTFIEGCRIRLSKRSPIQEHYQEHSTGTLTEAPAPNLQLVPIAPKANGGQKGGIDDESLLMAREVLKVTNPDSPMDHLLDAFFSIKPRVCTKAAAMKALNVALTERLEKRRHGA